MRGEETRGEKLKSIPGKRNGIEKKSYLPEQIKERLERVKDATIEEATEILESVESLSEDEMAIVSVKRFQE